MMSKEESGDLLENAKKWAKKEYERREKMKGPDALNELMILDQGLDWSAGKTKWRWLMAEEICGELGIKHHIMAMGRALENLSNYGLIKRCKMGQRTNYLLPPLRINKAIREKQEREKQKVDHPDYYKRGGIEAIDVIEAWGLGFNLGNVIKYVARAGHKTTFGRRDLEKAAWYLNRENLKAADTAGGRQEDTMKYQYNEDIKDMMWSMFWMTHDAYKANIDQLEKDIKTLIHMTVQKTAGQRPDRMKDVSWNNLERIQMNIICGATVLYLTGCLDELRKIVKSKGGDKEE